MRIECERNEWILRYLEKGSEKSFNNFCTALRNSNQGFLVTAMDESIGAARQRPCNNNESRPVPGRECTEGAPVTCSESAFLTCTEYTGDETTTPSTEITTECTQGFILLSC